MRNALWLLAASTIWLLAACGSGEPKPEPEPMPMRDTVAGEMVGTMDKARGVEDTVMQEKDQLDRQIQESDGGE